jgi:serine/threonine protein kinase
VYLARDTQLDRPVALKVPRLSGHEEQDVLDRFLREARAAANLTHPNICRVFDVGSESGVWFIAMEFVDGRSLSEFIVPGHLHEEKRCANVVRKLASALTKRTRRGSSTATSSRPTF